MRAATGRYLTRSLSLSTAPTAAEHTIDRSDARFHPIIDRGQHGGGVRTPATNAHSRKSNDPGRGRARRRVTRSA